MSIRWRRTGELLCAAKCDEQPDDTYINDRLHYHLSQELKVIAPDHNEGENGLWHWLDPLFNRPAPETETPLVFGTDQLTQTECPDCEGTGWDLVGTCGCKTCYTNGFVYTATITYNAETKETER